MTTIKEIAAHFAEIQPREEKQCTTKRLSIAASTISRMMGFQEVTAIQFEDGSGKKFNYQLNGGQWQYINLTDIIK